MACFETINLTGASGKTYGFEVYPPDTVFPGGIACIFYVSRRNPGTDGGIAAHDDIYIGETDDIKQRLETRYKQECFSHYRYNAIAIHREDVKLRRFAAEVDLIHGLNPPCNNR